MKRVLIILSVFIIVFLSSCQVKYIDNGAKIDGESAKEAIKVSERSSPRQYIGVRSTDQLDEMRSMIAEKDDKILAEYLLGVEGGGAENREDLIDFVDLVDSLPAAKLIDGDVIWIAHYYNVDASGERTNGTLYVSTLSDNGDWTRIEYKLSETDIKAEIEAARSDKNNLIEEKTDVLTYGDGMIKVYYQAKQKHPSGTGDVYEWITTIDGKIAHVVYYTSGSDEVTSSGVFDGIKVTRLNMS